MYIGLLHRPLEKIWGGDLKALTVISEGLNNLGIKTSLSDSPEDMNSCDFVFLSNACLNMEKQYEVLKKTQKNYGIIPFYEDRLQFTPGSYGLYIYVYQLLSSEFQNFLPFTLESLLENPRIVELLAPQVIWPLPENKHILDNSLLCIANSHQESSIIKRDYPHIKVETVYWSPGFAEDFSLENSSSFLDLTGLFRGDYILQIGRMEGRKNQLGTLLACLDIDLPLVFIATRSKDHAYSNLVIQAAKKWRKAKTIIISEDLPSSHEGSCQVISMPRGQKLHPEILKSAYQNASALVHPAFSELPGYTYLEAIALGTPIVASSWTTIKDYFTDHLSGHYTLDDRIVYVEPLDFLGIKQAILKQMNKKFLPSRHPMILRTKTDVATNLLSHIQKCIPC